MLLTQNVSKIFITKQIENSLSISRVIKHNNVIKTLLAFERFDSLLFLVIHTVVTGNLNSFLKILAAQYKFNQTKVKRGSPLEIKIHAG